jgi:hypothetical protein
MDDNPQLHDTTSTPHQLESLRDDIEMKPSSQQVSSPVSSKKKKEKICQVTLDIIKIGIFIYGASKSKSNYNL